MIELAKSERPLPLTPDKLDRDPWLLNFSNLTVSLRDGSTKKHDPADLITKTTGIRYPTEQGDEPVLWLEVLDAVLQGDTELIRFLQRALGSALVGEVIEHMLLLFWGHGANGKSVILETLLAALGEYGMKAPANMLMASRGDRHPCELADLYGKRLVCVTETADGARLNEPLVKELCGGDSLRVRRMRENFWQFRPSHQLILATNFLPTIRGTDNGIWRRMRLVPFRRTFSPAEQDPKLGEKLRGELPLIAKWMVEGAIAWQREGLQAPQQVLAATSDYRSDSDTFSQWFDEKLMSITGGEVKAKEAWNSYTNWCEQNKERAVTRTRFGERMSEKISGKRKSGDIWYVGITWL